MNRKKTRGKAPERLRDLQQRFAAHLRDPDRHAAPDDVEDRRMAIYRGLFYRNIRNFLSGNFPVLKKLHEPERWDALVRDFYRRHRSRTPLFPEIAREFLQFLQEERGDGEGDPPFMLELAHYEWVELALSLDERNLDDAEANPDGDLLEGIPVLSPLAWSLSYRFPVHEIRPEYQPATPPDQPTHLLVYRNRGEEVKFMRLNAVSALLVEQLKDTGGRSGLDILKQIAQRLGGDEKAVVDGGRQLLEDLRDRDIVLGTRPA